MSEETTKEEVLKTFTLTVEETTSGELSVALGIDGFNDLEVAGIAAKAAEWAKNALDEQRLKELFSSDESDENCKDSGNE